MFFKMIAAISLAASSIVPTHAATQDKPMKLESMVQLLRADESGADSQPQLVEPQGVVPGDTLVFTTTYHNGGSSAVKNFVIVNPVSAELLLSAEAADQTEVSVDGAKNWGRLGTLTVSDINGQKRLANAGDITHLRWVVDEVPAQGTGKVQFSARVR